MQPARRATTAQRGRAPGTSAQLKKKATPYTEASMGAARVPPDEDESSFSAREPQPITPAAQAAAQVLPLDREELRMLEVFHRSFNLPGLRLGLVQPVIEDEYYPEDFEEQHADADDGQRPHDPPEHVSPSHEQRQHANPRACAVYHEPDVSAEMSALLAQTRGLHVEAAHVLDDEEIVEEEDIPSDTGHVDEAFRPQQQQQQQQYSAAATHTRKVLSRPGSAARPPSAGGSSMANRRIGR